MVKVLDFFIWNSNYRLLWNVIVLQLLLNMPTISQCLLNEHPLVSLISFTFRNIQNLCPLPVNFSPTMWKYISSTWMKYFIHQAKYCVHMDEICNPCAKKYHPCGWKLSSTWQKHSLKYSFKLKEWSSQAHHSLLMLISSHVSDVAS